LNIPHIFTIFLNQKKSILLFLIPVSLSSCLSGNELKPGITARDFYLETADHKRFYLHQQRGKVVILVFWTTWCTICKLELKDLNTMLKKESFNNLVIAAVCSDPENIGDLKAIQRHLDIKFPVLLDKNGKVSHAYGIKVYPSTVVIGRSGKISLVKKGYNVLILNKIKSKLQELLPIK